MVGGCACKKGADEELDESESTARASGGTQSKYE